jgi:uncharacterized protein (DUF488 family)
MSGRIWTIGHSTRAMDELLALLQAHGVRSLVDVRKIPMSRRNPQFNRENLQDRLVSAGLSYRHAPELGGLRKSRPDSPNTGWRNASFRGYADYMQTEGFQQALEQLMAGAQTEPTAILCAEAVPWRCHRSLIADALTSRDWTVGHILTAGPPSPHQLTPFARREGDRLVYPPPSADADPKLF